ncbi:MAG TPA: lipid-A-disaccharide synthase N-terminal domain-containing protein [Chryseosolibacter sp.]|nr:lipid-A-disaccharide synthase N-terminal domain-containing protein [Chryseosolibacter sp.]
MHTVLTTYWVFGVGFIAQSLFGFRIFYQWWLAEKTKESVSPSLFWKFSLAASALFLVYGILRVDIVIILGQMVGYFIYIRNLQLKKEWNKFPGALQAVIVAIPFAALAWTFMMAGDVSISDSLFQDMNPFFIAGISGQLLLNIRFIYQLYYSEQHSESILPLGFWLLSLAGSILVVAYAIYRLDPVLMLAQGTAIVPYFRNIVLARGRAS